MNTGWILASVAIGVIVGMLSVILANVMDIRYRMRNQFGPRTKH